MTSPSQRDFSYQLHQHARKGGKTHRRRQVQRVFRILRWAGVSEQRLSRRQIFDFYRQCGSDKTRRDYFYALKLMWRALGRQGDPPHPED